MIAAATCDRFECLPAVTQVAIVVMAGVCVAIVLWCVLR